MWGNMGVLLAFTASAIALTAPSTACADELTLSDPPTLPEVVNAFRSGDEGEVAAAQRAVLALGPEALPGLRRLCEVAAEAERMHGWLHARPPDGATWEERVGRVEQAIEYFRVTGGVHYLLGALEAPELNTQLGAASALAALDPDVKAANRRLLVAASLRQLARWPALIGSLATDDHIRRQTLWGLLAELVGVEAVWDEHGHMSVKNGAQIVAAASEWLAAHPTEEDQAAPAATPAGDPGT